MNCDVRFCLRFPFCDRRMPPLPRLRWFRRRPTFNCDCGIVYRATRSGWVNLVKHSRLPGPGYPSRSSVEKLPPLPKGLAPGALEARVPVLNPWAGVAVVALHSHTADEPCDERCSTHGSA